MSDFKPRIAKKSSLLEEKELEDNKMGENDGKYDMTCFMMRIINLLNEYCSSLETIDHGTLLAKLGPMVARA